MPLSFITVLCSLTTFSRWILSRSTEGEPEGKREGRGREVGEGGRSLLGGFQLPGQHSKGRALSRLHVSIQILPGMPGRLSEGSEGGRGVLSRFCQLLAVWPGRAS